MSATTPKADMCGAKGNVRFVPRADIASLFTSTLLSRRTSTAKGRRSYTLPVTIIWRILRASGYRFSL